MKTHRVKPKKSLAQQTHDVVSTSTVGYFSRGEISYAILSGRYKNVFFRGMILQKRFSPGNFPGWIQPVYWDRVFNLLIDTFNACNKKNKYIHILFNLPAGIYLFKVNIGNTRAMCEICSNLTIQTPERLLFEIELLLVQLVTFLLTKGLISFWH